MKIILAICFAMAFTVSAYAQNAVSGSASQANNTANQVSASGAIASGGSVNIASAPPTQRIEYGGSYDVNSVPSGVVGPGFSSGHPCGYAPISGGLAVIGGGLSLGGQKSDDACLLAQMGMTQEAMLMIASRNPDACAALLATGKIGAGSCSPDKSKIVRRSSATVSSKSAPKKVLASYGKCEFVENKIKLTVRRGEDRATAIAQCRSKLGM